MNKTSIRKLLAKRKSEILNNIKLLRRELSEIRAMEQALTIQSDDPKNSRNHELRSNQSLTFQDMIMLTLKSTPEGATANELLEMIDGRFNKKIMRSSISPQLSRLKQKGKVTLKDGMWAIISDSPETPDLFEELPQQQNGGTLG
jgi:hypothetical protein